MPQPIISIIIPFFNRRRFLRSAVVSALQARGPHREVIVVDDGSTDDGMGVLEGLPVVPIRHSRRLGMSEARDSGRERARGEFVTFLDSDDQLSHDGLVHRLDLFRAVPQRNVVGGLVQVLGGDPLYVPPLLDKKTYLTSGGLPIALWSFIFRRDFLESLGKFDATLKVIPDSEFILRVLERESIPFSKQVCVNYRVHGGQASIDPQTRQMSSRALAESILLNWSLPDLQPLDCGDSDLSRPGY